MPGFEDAYAATMRREGGYVLHKVPGDTGGQTYAGISRVHNGQWAGWPFIDRGETPPTALVRDFYYSGYWAPIRGDQLRYDIAASIYDFAVNTSAPGRPTVAVKLAQVVAGVEPDGVVGPRTVAALNALSTNAFGFRYFVGKCKRYAQIVARDPTQAKFFAGWINRAVESLT